MREPVGDVDVDHEELGVVFSGQFGGSADDPLTPAGSRDAGNDERSVWRVGQPTPGEKLLAGGVGAVGHPRLPQLAERLEVGRPEVVAKRAPDAIGGVHVAGHVLPPSAVAVGTGVGKLIDQHEISAAGDHAVHVQIKKGAAVVGNRTRSHDLQFAELRPRVGTPMLLDPSDDNALSTLCSPPGKRLSRRARSCS